MLLLCLLLSGCSAPSGALPEAGPGFLMGFGKWDITPPDVGEKTYYVAGYRTDHPARGVLSPLWARAVYVDDQRGGGGLVLAAVDCVGLSYPDVQDIRRRLSPFLEETGCRAVHVMSTHTHAGVDTLGLWGPLPQSGRDESQMERVKEGVVQAVKAAFLDARPGTVTYAAAPVENLIRDTRDPQVYDNRLHRLRFIPETGREIYLLNFAAHPEALGADNALLSPDYPAAMGRYIETHAGADFIFFTGATGGLINTLPQDPDPYVSARITGEMLGKAALSMEKEHTLAPAAETRTERVTLPLHNSFFILGAFLDVMSARAVPGGGGPYHLALESEVSLVEIGDVSIALIPGEVFPELMAEGGLIGKAIGRKDTLVFGLANDEIGYILPEESYLLHPEHPYLLRIRDTSGEDHYEETNSLSPHTAGLLAQAFERLCHE